MSTAAKVGAAFILGALIGGGGGGVGGFKLGTTLIVSNWATAEANSTDDIVGALELLRAKKAPEAAAAFEEHLDQHVVGLMPQTREGFTLSELTLERLRTAKTKAQAYRVANPRAETKSARAKDVDAYLASD